MDDAPHLPDAAHAGRVLGGDDGFGRALQRWAADAGVDEAARQRARQRWLRTQAEEEASLAGALLDLAERARTVTLEVGSERVRGRIVGVGEDFVAVRSDRGQHVLVRTGAVEVVRAEPGTAAVVGDRTSVVDVGLTGLLPPLAAERPEVRVRTRSGLTVRGDLVAAGSDVVRLRVPGDPPAPAWVPTATIDVLVLDP